MYSTPYGFQPAAAGPSSFDGTAQPPQSVAAHMQPGSSPTQPQQQMMYNPQQQFSMGSQGPFPGGPNPNMMPGAMSGAGMMQSAAMPHNGQMAYQTPYSGSPYGPGVPSPAGGQGQMPANYMMAGPMGGGGFPMNPAAAAAVAGGGNMGAPPPQQQMMSRMHHPQQQQSPAALNMPTPPRPFNPGQGSPTAAMTPQQQAQFSTAQASQAAALSQAANNAKAQMTPGGTPQTPTFPTVGPGSAAAAAANGAVSTPLSPGTESREKERFQLLLDINQELLYESVQLQNTKAELRKEATSSAAEGGGKPPASDSPEDKLIQLDYTQCMRRLHSNLAYLAVLADKKGKDMPASPAYLMAPSLNLGIKMRGPTAAPANDGKEKQPVDPTADRAERDKGLQELYRRLQALFPDVNPAIEPQGNAAGGQGQPARRAAGAGGASSAEASPMVGPGGQRTPQMAQAQAPTV